jgi:hypothetical protein
MSKGSGRMSTMRGKEQLQRTEEGIDKGHRQGQEGMSWELM